jgi:hypothetical protein
MKGKIDKRGSLYIERSGVMKTVDCPIVLNHIFCGDWCSLFGEPDDIFSDLWTEKDDLLDDLIKEGDFVKVSLCWKDLVFSRFTDERKYKKGN